MCCPIVNVRITAKKPNNKPYPPLTDHSLGAALKRRRLDLNWTQEQTAKHFGILKDSYQNFEWNIYVPYINKRKCINQFLEFNFWDDGSDTLKNHCLNFRIEQGLTMTRLAHMVGVSCATIERLEKGISISVSMKNTIKQFLTKQGTLQ